MGSVGVVHKGPVLVLAVVGTEIVAAKVLDVLLSYFVKEPGFSSR